MAGRRPRRTGLLDGMILVAGAAAGLAALKIGPAGDDPAEWLEGWLGDRLAFGLFGPTLAVLAIRLRRPRPGWRRLACQPGFAGLAAVALAGAFHLATGACDPRAFGGRLDAWFLLWLAAERSAPAVPIAWLGLIAARRWRPEPGAIDRLGRLLAAAWIATTLLQGDLGRRLTNFS